jgi:hypothetical protein
MVHGAEAFATPNVGAGRPWENRRLSVAEPPLSRYRPCPNPGRIPTTMSEVTTIQVGQPVPDFELETYEPSTKNFGKYSLAEAKKNGKWTLLFFYPADFTFV